MGLYVMLCKRGEKSTNKKVVAESVEAVPDTFEVENTSDYTGNIFTVTRPTRKTRVTAIFNKLRKFSVRRASNDKGLLGGVASIEEEKDNLSTGKKKSKISFGANEERTYEKEDHIKRTSKISFRDTEEVQEYEKDLAIENDTKLKQHETHTKTASHLILDD